MAESVTNSRRWSYWIFRLEFQRNRVNCSECDAQIFAGGYAWVSRERGQPEGKVMKRVCSEYCGLEFDSRMMQEAADRRENVR